MTCWRSAIFVAILQWSHDLSAMDTRGSHLWQMRTWRPFNGAMTFQPWIHPQPKPVVITYSTFNGAMTFQPWIRRIIRIFRPNGPVRACDSRVRRAKCFSIDRCCLIISAFCPLFVRALPLQIAQHRRSRILFGDRNRPSFCTVCHSSLRRPMPPFASALPGGPKSVSRHRLALQRALHRS